MMRIKIAAVASISFFDNVIYQQIVEVEEGATWKDAYLAAMKNGLFNTKYDPNVAKWISELPDDLHEARKLLSDGDMDICVTFSYVELTEE